MLFRSNLFGGLSIIADKPFHIGDRIKVDQRFEGYVKEIGMRSTLIRTPNDTVLYIPNSVIASTVVENISASHEQTVRVVFNLSIDYKTTAKKIEEAVNIVHEILTTTENIIIDEQEIAPFVSFNEFKEYYLNIVYGYSIISSNKVSVTRQKVNIEIKKRFEHADIHFAYPTQTVYVKKE